MERKVKVLTDDEGKLLIDTLEGRDRIATMLGLYAGLHSSEVFKVRWDDVDSERGLLRIYSGKRGGTVSVPLTDALVAELKDYAANSTGDCLFDDHGVNFYVRYFYSLNRKFKRLLSAGVTFKTLRHTFATNLIKVETPIHAVSNLLGHTINTTIGKYACISWKNFKHV